ncbi:hypothetical protein RFI_22633 [Reticulomyxa filosa]|uniref:Uncharacterized protein n=1 Tax=Reticulomyxa filosa TaxID=46433 RepID=X6ML46_RETFI|nr:hypothetical protein RFI_22633 [Reticulomyxa filosa]|eukprot:ETO14738.1 hypothetical protein RFI_22633 [Reticulomyxa filosa]
MRTAGVTNTTFGPNDNKTLTGRPGALAYHSEMNSGGMVPLSVMSPSPDGQGHGHKSGQKSGKDHASKQRLPKRKNDEQDKDEDRLSLPIGPMNSTSYSDVTHEPTISAEAESQENIIVLHSTKGKPRHKPFLTAPQLAPEISYSYTDNGELSQHTHPHLEKADANHPFSDPNKSRVYLCIVFMRARGICNDLKKKTYTHVHKWTIDNAGKNKKRRDKEDKRQAKSLNPQQLSFMHELGGQQHLNEGPARQPAENSVESVPMIHRAQGDSFYNVNHPHNLEYYDSNGARVQSEHLMAPPPSKSGTHSNHESKQAESQPPPVPTRSAYRGRVSNDLLEPYPSHKDHTDLNSRTHSNTHSLSASEDDVDADAGADAGADQKQKRKQKRHARNRSKERSQKSRHTSRSNDPKKPKKVAFAEPLPIGDVQDITGDTFKFQHNTYTLCLL